MTLMVPRAKGMAEEGLEKDERGKMKKSVEERKKRKTNEEIRIESVVDNALTL